MKSIALYSLLFLSVASASALFEPYSVESKEVSLFKDISRPNLRIEEEDCISCIANNAGFNGERCTF